MPQLDEPTSTHSAHSPRSSGNLARTLKWAVVAINGWNRVAISFRNVPSSYQPKKEHA
jgi:hypothetical protein